MSQINTLLFDVGGVVLTNGWDHHARRRAATEFSLNYEELDLRHEPLFKILERGYITRDEYLNAIVFYQDRPFSRKDFIRFIEAQSHAHKGTLDLLQELKQQKRYLLATVNNESKELNLLRIKKFGLQNYFTAFFSSCFLGVRKPDAEIFEAALNVLQKEASECLFIDDREENVAGAARLGIHTILVRGISKLRTQLTTKGIQIS